MIGWRGTAQVGGASTLLDQSIVRRTQWRMLDPLQLHHAVISAMTAASSEAWRGPWVSAGSITCSLQSQCVANSGTGLETLSTSIPYSSYAFSRFVSGSPTIDIKGARQSFVRTGSRGLLTTPLEWLMSSCSGTRGKDALWAFLSGLWLGLIDSESSVRSFPLITASLLLLVLAISLKCCVPDPERSMPCTPRTNGKAELFIKAMLAECAYSKSF